MTTPTTSMLARQANENPGIVPPWLDPDTPTIPRPWPARIDHVNRAAEARRLEQAARRLANQCRESMGSVELGPTIACELDAAAVRFERAATMMAEEIHHRRR